jgi:cytidine deaminase
MESMVTTEQLVILQNRAREAISHSYCRYSQFPVAAAVLTTSGDIFTGVNVENASYGLTICAERSAICTAVSNGQQQLAAVVIYTPTKTPTPPCGTCRQFIREFSEDAKVVSICDTELRIETTIAELLPGAFQF